MSAPAAFYRPRNSQSSDYYRCVEDNFETFLHVSEERFEKLYGFFRSYIQKVIYRYLNCGDLHKGFNHPINVCYEVVFFSSIPNRKLLISR
ncbi:MAG: hypothetical protein COX51_05165 [Syntrophobacteraceae bacterium CG23_combo_of_CG06-09_8_20_14_all_50_8]|nr:MAG: hypothetical protein COX51_05165 [Syntrophobacteraceae bacterium CG23_combo_of_CG06-09_8_20_14_all_50_8]